MKKILVVTEIFYPEDFIINDLVRQWQATGVEVDVLTPWPSYPQGKVFEGYQNDHYGSEQWGEGTIYRFRVVEGYRESKIKKILNYLCYIRYSRKIAKKIGGNYDHVFAFQTGPITTAEPARYIKKKFGTPYTIWVLDLWPETFFEYGFPRVQPLIYLVDKLVESIISNADNVLASSAQFIAPLRRFTHGKDAAYIPNWMVKYQAQKGEITLDKSKFNFTFAGNIGMSVNLLAVVKGFVDANIDSAHLNIVGDGSCRNEIERYIERNNVTNVTLHHRVAQCKVDDVLEQSDAVVLSIIPTPGIMKVEPFKIQTYLKSGKPIYGVTLGAGREIIELHGLGLCADPNDLAEISQGFSKMISFAANNTSQVREASAKLMQGRFNREQIIERINQIIGINL